MQTRGGKANGLSRLLKNQLTMKKKHRKLFALKNSFLNIMRYFLNERAVNLIERLWKFLRKKVINTGFYRTKGEFRKAIRDFFDRISGYKEELEKLLTLNFRLINSKTISV